MLQRYKHAFAVLVIVVLSELGFFKYLSVLIRQLDNGFWKDLLSNIRIDRIATAVLGFF